MTALTVEGWRFDKRQFSYKRRRLTSYQTLQQCSADKVWTTVLFIICFSPLSFSTTCFCVLFGYNIISFVTSWLFYCFLFQRRCRSSTFWSKGHASSKCFKNICNFLYTIVFTKAIFLAHNTSLTKKLQCKRIFNLIWHMCLKQHGMLLTKVANRW